MPYAMKTNKSFSKRLKVSKNGKITARTPGQNHFNARQSAAAHGRMGRTKGFHMVNREKRRFLSGI